jgi:XTP/dITP diphosphohydrolase
MSAKLLLATANKKKLVELQRILDAALGIDRVTLVGLADFHDYPDVPETGLTFGENALIKAREGASRTGLPTVADDSGLAVDALNGMPGVFSARWSGRHGDDQANLDLVLGQIGDVPDQHRGGAFVCAAALVLPGGTERVIEREWRGTVIREERGDNGFGYDPVFVPEGLEVTSAQLSPGEKDARSHRGQAFAALVPVIAELLGAR